ncbi:hypothetical protein [Streptomyces violascens]|uniref:Uncharacterized protein n=1 Tax=Streptomyces violascens TaxID=67381 RepID=A0ABQ3QGG6_9ACTN|nr:hypothetical protein [Streptomyces violascens]GGT89681.1 hypothetical protein GCM10010289_07170 [Streptomyces violascens]GHI36382.1 hypothetical protein Sviol_07900 [Streptomyces violascens]
MNAPHSTTASRTGRGPLRRAAVLLALLLGTALVAGPVTAEAAPRTTVVASTAQQAASVGDVARPDQAAGQAGRHTVAGKSSVLVSKSSEKSKKSSKSKKKKSSFFKKLGIFLLILVILFIAFVVFVIWFIVSRLRRRRDRH